MGYRCEKGRSRECYNVEHIVDTENSNLVDKENPSRECNLNILGNLVMADGGWNQDVGQLPWKCVREEKLRVYGDVFTQAVAHVLACNPNCSFSDDTATFLRKNSPRSTASSGPAILVLLLLVMTVIPAVVLLHISRYRASTEQMLRQLERDLIGILNRGPR